jgi:hypothetical protein
MDEFDIEITPLEGIHDGDTPDPDRTGGSGARSPFASRLTRRGKLVRMTTTWGAVLLACALIAASSPALRGMLGSFLHVAMPTGYAATAPGSETIYFEHAVPWGKLTIDGRKIPPPTDTTTDSVTVAPGKHTLVYDAPPFATLLCHFQVPITAQDDCPLEFAPPQSAQQRDLYVRIVNLGATPDRLPARQTAALSEVIDTALGSLASQTYIPAGTRYLAADGGPATTTDRYVATLVFRLNEDPHIVVPYLPGGFLCSQICYLGDEYLGDVSGAPGGWGILALVHVTWNYAGSQGMALVQGAPSSPVPDGSVALVTVGVTWDGSWHAMAVSGENQFGMSPICEIANNLLPTTLATGSNLYTVTLKEIPARTAADGCLLTVQVNHGATPGPTALVIYRFGVLFAVNDEAHLLYPQLPPATPNDRSIAEDIALAAHSPG